MASLAEQKDHTLRLVEKVDELAGGLGDMEVRVVACGVIFCACVPTSTGRERCLGAVSQ